MKTKLVTILLMVGNLGCHTSVDTSKQDVVKDETRSASYIESQIDLTLSKMTLEEKSSMVHASGKFHVNSIPRLGINEMWLSDGPHGVRHQIQRHSWDSAGWDDDHATYLPHLTSVAASWDVNMARLHGNVLGSEARERGKDIILGPGVNLARLPLYGRNFEYMGEDPFLASRLVIPEVKAIQSHDVAANVKHYALNTQELNRTGVNAKPDERTLREIYLPVFEAAVKEANVYSIMGAYNQYMGTNANQSEHLVKNILKTEWGFDGVLLTDWNVDINTFDAAINGLDLEMGTNVESYDDYFFADPLIAAIKSGQIAESVLDDKVRRILRLQHRIGMYDKARKTGKRNTPEHQKAARDIAANGVVLLKNNEVSGKHILPLNKSTIKNVLVMGPNANKKHGQGGGSSEVKSLYEITPLQGLRNALGSDVEITVMRARSSKLSPIASDYIASRHWTGTPAWNISFYQDHELTELTEESWIVDAYYNNSNTLQKHLRMSAKLAPLSDGDHTFKLDTIGNAKVFIDGVELITNVSAIKPHQLSATMSLLASKTYDVTIEYHGANYVMLGWDAPGNLFDSEERYLNAAKNADAVIYVGGLSHGDDRESIDRDSMVLPFGQDEILSNLLAANPSTVVLMVAGSAVEMPWIDQANAVLWGWYGGMEAGNAFADVIFGDVNPAARLPITLPQHLEDTAAIALNDYNAKESLYKEGVFIGYRWFTQQGTEPLFPFGYGLSYSKFKTTNLTLSSDQISRESEQEITVSVDVRNIGNMAGSHVVQVYVEDVEASVSRPKYELKGFTKILLQPGERQRVSVKLGKRELSFWHTASNSWRLENGKFKVHIGKDAAAMTLSAILTAVD